MPNDDVLVVTPTLTSVAKQTGFSIATVSRVLNHGGPATAKTRQRILEVAEEQGYVPDPRFRLMGGRRRGKPYRTGNLGVVLGKRYSRAGFVASGSYGGRIFWSLEQEASKCRRNLVLSTYGGGDEQYVPRFVQDLHVDGVIVADQLDPGVVRRMSSLMPIVLVNAEVEGMVALSLMPDEASCIRKALDYLASLGHRRIGYFCIDDGDPPCVHHRHRTAAFASMTRAEPDRFAPITAVLPRREFGLVETAADQLRAWGAAGQMPTALLCAGDYFALAFLEAAEQLGIRVPADLSVMGVDDVVEASGVRPKLTTVRQALEAMGRTAVQTLVRLIDAPADEEPVKAVQLFDVELVIRDSCGPCSL